MLNRQSFMWTQFYTQDRTLSQFALLLPVDLVHREHSDKFFWMKPSGFLPNSALFWYSGFFCCFFLFFGPQSFSLLHVLFYFFPVCLCSPGKLLCARSWHTRVSAEVHGWFCFPPSEQRSKLSDQSVLFHPCETSSLFPQFFYLCFNYQQLQKLDSLHEYA